MPGPADVAPELTDRRAEGKESATGQCGMVGEPREHQRSDAQRDQHHPCAARGEEAGSVTRLIHLLRSGLRPSFASLHRGEPQRGDRIPSDPAIGLEDAAGGRHAAVERGAQPGGELAADPPGALEYEVTDGPWRSPAGEGTASG